MTMAIALRIVLILLGGYLLVMTFYQCQRLYSDYNRTFWCFVGTLVYQYAGIHSDQKESGTGNSDFTFKSGYRTIVDRNRGI